jgi:hypothetical protein
MIIKRMEKCPPSFNLFTDFKVVTDFSSRQKKEKGGWKEGLREVTISIFNDLDRGKELCLGPLFHFLMILL